MRIVSAAQVAVVVGAALLPPACSSEANVMGAIPIASSLAEIPLSVVEASLPEIPPVSVDIPLARPDIPVVVADVLLPDVPSTPPDVSAVGPALPALDAATEAYVRAALARGVARGNARDVVAKIGDSITESASFLADCGHGWYQLGVFADLESTIGYFSARALPGGENSLARSSLSATAGWTAQDALAGGDPASPLARELDAIHPQWAVVMYGTNDLDRVDVATYAADLAHVVDLIESRAAIPVLSTIPPRTDAGPAGSRVAAFNDTVRALARTRHLPLVDYWAGLLPLPTAGLSPDGIHPDVLHGSEGCDFTVEGLLYGYNLRNLLTLQMLARLRAY